MQPRRAAAHGGNVTEEGARGLAEYERRLQTTRDANAAREALTRGDTQRAATILSANPEVWIEVDGQQLMGEAAASYLTRNARQTAADAGRRLAVQPPDLSNRGVPQLSMPPGAPSGQIPLDVARASASLPPPPSPSTAGDRFATRGGIDRAAAQRQRLEAEFARQQLQASTSAQSGVGARPRTSQAGGGEGERGGTSYTVSVHELGATRWSSQISPEQIGRQLYRNAARAQGLSDAQAEAFTSYNVGIPHVIDERGRVRQMTRSDLDNAALIGNSHNTNQRGEYNAIVPHEVLAQMREFKQQWEAGAAANPLPMGGGAIPFPAPRPLELPRVSAAGAARTAATIVGAAGEAALPFAAGAVSAAPFAYMAWQVGQEIGQSRAATEAAQERARVLPPMRMTDEDEPLPTSPAAPTDTAGRAQPPRIRVAPEGGESLARPTASNPTTTTPTSPPPQRVPRQAPPPPELPPVDLDRLLPTALTAASLGRLAQQRRQQSPARVAQAGDRPDLVGAYRTNADVPAHYRSDPRFNSLASDPDHGGRIRPESRGEAMAGLEAEAQGLVRGINRGPRGIEFYDADGRPWDVKAPPSPRHGATWSFNPSRAGQSIMDELRTRATPPGAPAGTFPHGQTGLPEPRRVILDSTYLNDADHRALWQWLNQNLTQDELSRIVEVNTRP